MEEIEEIIILLSGDKNADILYRLGIIDWSEEISPLMRVLLQFGFWGLTHPFKALEIVSAHRGEQSPASLIHLAEHSRTGGEI